MSTDDSRISLTEQQLDDLLRKWKRKGAERVVVGCFGVSVLLAALTAFFPALQRVEVFASLYCGVALFVAVTS